MLNQHNKVPFWLIGVLVALVLILIGQRVSGSGNPALMDAFRAKAEQSDQPAPPDFQLPQVNLPQLPPDAQKAITSIRDRLAGGQAVPALTPVATSVRVRVEVKELKRTGDSLQIRGTLANISNANIDVPSSAFTFRDSVGIAYSLGGDSTTTIEGGAQTDFDLSVPLPQDRGLTLILTLPPDQPIQQTLIVATTGN